MHYVRNSAEFLSIPVSTSFFIGGAKFLSSQVPSLGINIAAGTPAQLAISSLAISIIYKLVNKTITLISTNNHTHFLLRLKIVISTPISWIAAIILANNGLLPQQYKITFVAISIFMGIYEEKQDQIEDLKSEIDNIRSLKNIMNGTSAQEFETRVNEKICQLVDKEMKKITVQMLESIQIVFNQMEQMDSKGRNHHPNHDQTFQQMTNNTMQRFNSSSLQMESLPIGACNHPNNVQTSQNPSKFSDDVD